MKKAIILLSAIMSVIPLTVMADEYIDPQTNVVYTYEPGQPTASVKAGYDEVISEGYGYELEVITHPGSPDAAGDVAILDKFTIGTAEYVVTSIGECAFWMNKNIKSVSIPETVTDIEAGAFKYCDSLTAVQLPDGLTQIADGLFYGCSQLVSVNIPSSVCSIGSYAFSQCSSLNNLTLPANLTFIGRFAFQNTPWYSTQYNEAPDGPFYIGPQLVGYKGDAPTGELTIKDGTTCIGTEALRNCNRLTSVTIPESVAYIDYEAFFGCAGLKAVHITNMAAWCNIEFQEEFRSSSNPLFYAHHLYLNGEEVTDLVIPDGVTSIGRYAFDNCTALTSITISDGVTRVGSQAFRSCGNLTSVTIPKSVTAIESYAFIWCFNLNAVHISDLAAWCGNSFYHSCLFTYGAHFYLKGEEVKDLVIPEGVAGIGNGTFEDYSYLTSVTIPKSVTTIGENAFNGCKNLTDVYCHADSVPSTEAWVFYDTPIASATLHVPAGSIEEYKTTSPWSGFGNIVALPIEINETNFPDEEFRTWVLAQSYGQDGVLTEEEIEGVTKIYFNIYNKIHSLKGIEYFTELTILGCTANLLTELDVSKCTKLTHLECDWNQLTALDVSKNTALTVLICGANQLTTLDVSKNTTLNELHCFKNQLTELDVSNNVELTNLNCHENQLTALDLSNNTMLEDVWCSQNQLTTLKVSACATLRYLRCYENRLIMLDVSGCSALKDLICMNNQIKGEAMDALVESLPTVGRGGSLGVINHVNEQNVMTKSQVAAAKAKGWYVHYYNDKNQWENYEGSDDPVTYTEGQMATIILPEEPDASKGKYYRLDRVEEGKIVFEQELHPQAHVPYIIVPNEDFSIDLSTLDLEGLRSDTVSIEGVSFIGSYVSKELPALTGGEGGGSSYIQIIDTTPDCSISFSEETGKETFLIGALRAYLTWDDPYNQGGTKGRGDMEIVLLDYGTSIGEIKNEQLKIKNDVFDLSGKKIVNGQLQRGIYIENGRKKTAK